MNTLGFINPLNNIVHSGDTNVLIDYFHELLKHDRKKALSLIDDESLQFCSLFLLKGEIYQLNLFNDLNQRNKTALTIINELTTGNKNELAFDDLSLNYIQIVYSTLKWILETGAVDDGLNNEYDKILDMAAIFLIKVYRDKTVLSCISDMIFKRNMRDLYFHDLIWAFFEIRDVESLVFIAKRLKSTQQKDVELACILLNFLPGIDINSKVKMEDQYLYVVKWIEENSSFSFFRGESFNQTSNPIPYEVAWEAKYLCKKVYIDTGKTIDELNIYECELLDQFNKLNYHTKKLLSNYSYRLHRKNIYWWNVWINYPITEQIRISIIGEL